MEGSALAHPGFIAFRQNGCGAGRLAPPAIPALDRRSGRVPALPYPPSRLGQYMLFGPDYKNMFAETALGGL